MIASDLSVLASLTRVDVSGWSNRIGEEGKRLLKEARKPGLELVTWSERR